MKLIVDTDYQSIPACNSMAGPGQPQGYKQRIGCPSTWLHCRNNAIPTMDKNKPLDNSLPIPGNEKPAAPDHAPPAPDTRHVTPTADLQVLPATLQERTSCLLLKAQLKYAMACNEQQQLDHWRVMEGQRLEMLGYERMGHEHTMAQITEHLENLQAWEQRSGESRMLEAAIMTDAKSRTSKQLEKSLGESQQIKTRLQLILQRKEENLWEKKQLSAILDEAKSIAKNAMLLLGELDFMLRPQALGTAVATLPSAMQARVDEFSQRLGELEQLLAHTQQPQQPQQALLLAAQDSHGLAALGGGEDSMDGYDDEDNTGTAIADGKPSAHASGDFDASENTQEMDAAAAEDGEGAGHAPAPGDAFIGMITMAHAPGFLAHQPPYAGGQDHLDPVVLKITPAVRLDSGLWAVSNTAQMLAGLVGQATVSDFSAPL